MPPATRIPDVFQQIIELAQEQRVNPFMGRVNLGGAAGAGGGAGSPPGGFLGQLIQRKVAYDTTEGSTLSTGSSSSLVDNLNHIRYRVAVLEAALPGAGGGTTGAAEYAQSEYAGGDVALGTTVDGAWVDVAVASLSITPSVAGTYQAGWEFTHVSGFAATGSSLTVEFRITDGVTSISTSSHNQQNADAIPISLRGLFTWTDTTLKTVKLQKKIVEATTAPASNFIMAGGTGAGVIHMDIFRLGGANVSQTEEAYERAWWGW